MSSIQNEFSLFPPSVVVVVALEVTLLADASTVLSKATAECVMVVSCYRSTGKTNPVKMTGLSHTIDSLMYCIKIPLSTPLQPAVVVAVSFTLLPVPTTVLVETTTKCIVIVKSLSRMQRKRSFCAQKSYLRRMRYGTDWTPFQS